MTKSSPDNMPLQQPSLPWRMTSTMVMGLTAALSRVFLYGLNSVEVTGLQRFLDVLDKRKDIEKRQRGLITVSNHISVLDDPVMWGVLPFRYSFNPSNFRWELGAHDICFKNKLSGSFFSAGQVLPTHRARYSSHGGLFQPTISQAIRLLSSQPFTSPQLGLSEETHDVSDPFTAGGLTYTTNGVDRYVAPSVYAQNRHSWVHIFPEACVHQHAKMFLRYFKWGVSRLILESEPVPDVMPVFIDGTQRIMPEDRGWPRFLPRFGVRFRVAFGELLDAEKTFGDLRTRWQELVRREREKKRALAMGELSDELKYGREAVDLRIEVARRVRDEILKLRRSMGYPDEEEPLGFELAETWAREPAGEKFRSNVDDSLVNKRE
ncbi:acyltransferase [Xylariaceae sp. FL0662B]|nr:acyltransferase [Xylariaceae sp. FL0662B]